MGVNGLLLLTSTTRSVLVSSLLKSNLIAASNRLTNGVLYVYHWLPPGGCLQGGSAALPLSMEQLAHNIGRCSLVSSKVYSQAQLYCPKLDIRVLFEKSFVRNARPTVPIDLVLVEADHDLKSRVTKGLVKAFVEEHFRISNSDFEIEFVQQERDAHELDGESIFYTTTEEDLEPVPFAQLFPNVALGGTFDRMHIAHKILISEAVLRCSEELIVGVTDDEMIKSKLLYELIEACDKRLERVNDFLRDISPGINARVVPINDPFGPTVSEKEIHLLVVSRETLQGGKKINEIRQRNAFPPILVHSIQLYEERKKESEHEEDKISSSSQRIRNLGDRLRPPRKSPSLPYIIGLTGGICSGKSTLCTYLNTLGIPSINCDHLGHEAYKKGTQCFEQVVNTFGGDIVEESGFEINRRALGAKVFASPSELTKLNSIVWPEIQTLISERIQGFINQGEKVIVLDAAILLEAKWDEMCHDVWVVIIPKEEAIRRVQARDEISMEDAERRVNSQVSNHERVKRATFVFSSFWEHDFTQRQANKAWKQIKPVIDSL